MNLTGANNFSENNIYTIYTINSNQNGQYSVVIPKNMNGQTSMIVDINMKNDFDALVSNAISKESLLDKIDKEYNKIKATNPDGILVIPMTDMNSLTNAVNSNDKQKIFDETKKIGGITSELYKNLTDSGLDKSKINQKIMIIEKDEIDTKFVEWLKNQMPNFVDGLKVASDAQTIEQAPAENNDPFAGFNPFGEENNSELAPAQPAEVVASQEPVTHVPEPVAEPTPVPAQPTEVAAPQEPVAEPTPVPTQPTEVVAPQEPVTPVPEPVVENETIPEPTPINSVSLENTQAIPQPEPTPTPAPTATVNDIDKKSGGFANILILLVILAVVTIGSIELGKFLFNTFGA